MKKEKVSELVMLPPEEVEKRLRVSLRRLVDIIWNEATESTQVPSTDWADRLLDKWIAEENNDQL